MCTNIFWYLQRKWNVGDKFSHLPPVEAVLPKYDSHWVAFPIRRKREGGDFSPKEDHLPIGNAADLTGLEFYEIWLKMFLPAAEMAAKFTNEKGREKFGLTWRDIDEVTLLKFHAIFIWMSVRPRPSVRSYFSTTEGDSFVLSVGMSRNQFERICSSFRLYSPKDATQNGWSDRYR